MSIDFLNLNFIFKKNGGITVFIFRIMLSYQNPSSSLTPDKFVLDAFLCSNDLVATGEQKKRSELRPEGFLLYKILFI